jgi:hypothetical protein
MNWIANGKFKLVTNRPGKHYVYRRTNSGNMEYNVPVSIRTKAEARRYLSLRGRNLKPNRVKTARKAAPVNYPIRWPWPTTGFVNAPMGLGMPVRPANSKFSCATRKDLGQILGRGRQGIVFKCKGPVAAKICPKDLAASARKEPQPVMVEFTNQKAAMAAAPEGVVKVYDLVYCENFIEPSVMDMKNVQNSRKYDKTKQGIIFMEYCSGGSLLNWLKEKPRNDAAMHHLITSILRTLAKIKKSLPDFRHNDLHIDNVFVADRGFLIGDFGWSRIAKNGTNPAVNTANGTTTANTWGVGPKTDARYDSHNILNNLRDWLAKRGGVPATRAFLDAVVPVGYRGDTDVHVTQGRLKYGDPCPGLPTLEAILRTKYITGRKFNSPNLREAKNKLKKVVPGQKRLPFRSLNLRLAKMALKKKKPAGLPFTAAQLRARKLKLKPARPRAKITPAQLKAVKLKPGRKTAKMPAALRKDPRFDKLVENLWRLNGAKSGANYANAWNSAKAKATRLVELRINAGNAPFSPKHANSVGRRAAPVKKAASPRRNTTSPARKAPSPPKKNLAEAGARLKKKAANLQAARAHTVLFVAGPPAPNAKYRKSPSSGRAQMKSNSARWVYVNLHMSLADLKKMARNKGKNIKGLRSKAEIARKIFG